MICNENTLDLCIKQGSTFQRTVILTDENGVPVDLASCMVRGQIRSTASSSAVIASFTAQILTPTSEGKFKISLTATQTAAIPVTPSPTFAKRLTRYVYDIEVVYSDSSVDRVLEGVVVVSPEVTK